jgi:integrase
MGGVLNYSNWRRDTWLPAKEATGFGYRFHDLRHTYATILIEAGQSMTTVAKVMGPVRPPRWRSTPVC